MGITHIEGTVRGPSGERAGVRFLVDSGANYTALPQDVWLAIGLTSSRRSVDLVLADGAIITRRMSECYIILPQGEGHTPVILGEPGDMALLGVITLEQLGLVLNPLTRELQPMRMRLAESRPTYSLF